MLSIVTLEHEKYLVGVQIATLLKRETFNMYRSMKIKEIPIRRASPEEIDFLCKCGAVRGGTHSVTLIPLAEALYFMADARSKAIEVGVRKANKTLSRRANFNPSHSFVESQPRIHRRKPFPWDLRRSLRPEDLVQHSKVSGTNSSIYLVEQPCACPPRAAQSTAPRDQQPLSDSPSLSDDAHMPQSKSAHRPSRKAPAFAAPAFSPVNASSARGLDLSSPLDDKGFKSSNSSKFSKSSKKLKSSSKRSKALYRHSDSFRMSPTSDSSSSSSFPLPSYQSILPPFVYASQPHQQHQFGDEISPFSL
jgi:hypothetical protein